MNIAEEDKKGIEKKIISENQLFEVQILSGDNVLPSLLSKEKKYYVIGTSKTPFKIKISVISKEDQNIYGARLFIDGNLIIYSKTFKSYGHFFGFKKGNGVYKEFIFDIPEVQESMKNSNNNEELGVIRIEFYNTIEKYVNYNNNSVKKEVPEYVAPKRNEDKKFFYRSLTIAEGETVKFENKNNNSEKGRFGKKRGNHSKEDLSQNVMRRQNSEGSVDFKLDESKYIDEVIIHYNDFNSLQILGIVSFRNLDHFHLIPNTLWSIDCAVSCLEAILASSKYKEGIKIDDIDEIFQKHTNKELIEFHNGDPFAFFQTKINVFNLSNDQIITLTNKEQFRKKFCELKFISQDYFKRAGINGQKQEKFIGQKRETVNIDLTSD